MYLVVSQPLLGDRRWYGPTLAGPVSIGAAREADVPIAGPNLRGRHAILHFGKARVRIELKSQFGVRIDGRLPRASEWLEGELTLGDWRVRLERNAPRGIDAVDEDFRLALEDPDMRAVYADSLEERGRVSEASIIRGERDAVVAARTPPGWRRTFLPITVEACPQRCGRPWTPDLAGREGAEGGCPSCSKLVPLCGNIAHARALAMAGQPVALEIGRVVFARPEIGADGEALRALHHAGPHREATFAQSFALLIGE